MIDIKGKNFTVLNNMSKLLHSFPNMCALQGRVIYDKIRLQNNSEKEEINAMKKMSSILLAIVMVVGLMAPMAVTASTDTPAVWDGTANIKWYLDGNVADTGVYEIKTAEDLAGLACLVNASVEASTCVNGVYYNPTTGAVLGYRAGSNFSQYKGETYVAYTPTDGDGSEVMLGSNFLGKKVKLCADIVLNEGNAADWEQTAPENNWMPIGFCNDAAAWEECPSFNGTFDGQGHTISGMYTNTTATPNDQDWGAGLFGFVAHKNATKIANLTLDKFYSTGTIKVGALASISKGQSLVIENCYVKNGTVNSISEQLGAFVSRVDTGSVSLENCGVENVTLKTPDKTKIGAFVGNTVSATLDIKNCYADVTVDTVNYAGLALGYAGGNTTVKLENVYVVADGTVSTADTGVAGVVYGGTNGTTTVTATNYYYVNGITVAQVSGDTTEGATAVTLADITGDAAKTTLVGFDWDTVWVTKADGTPVIELREAVDDDDVDEDDEDEDEDEDGAGAGNSATTEKSDKTETEAQTEAETEEKKGCGSSVGIASVAMIALTSGAALVIKKKKD